MKDVLFAVGFFTLMFFLIYTNDKDYKNVKRIYYDCKSETQKLIPLTPHQYTILLNSKSIEKFHCEKVKYTRYYVNLLKEKNRK